MTTPIKALNTLVTTFKPSSTDLMSSLEAICMAREPFLQKVKTYDELIASNPDFRPIEEYIFDLVMAIHLEEKQSDENYFDTKEWLDIEDKTLERGTELLNIMLYLTEAADNEVDISLDDFLNEFLLIDEDEFQDEYALYEDFLSNPELIDEAPAHIIEVARTMTLNPEINELFLPLLLFFKQPDAPLDGVQKLTPVEESLYKALLTYQNG